MEHDDDCNTEQPYTIFQGETFEENYLDSIAIKKDGEVRLFHRGQLIPPLVEIKSTMIQVDLANGVELYDVFNAGYRFPFAKHFATKRACYDSTEPINVFGLADYVSPEFMIFSNDIVNTDPVTGEPGPPISFDILKNIKILELRKLSELEHFRELSKRTDTNNRSFSIFIDLVDSQNFDRGDLGLSDYSIQPTCLRLTITNPDNVPLDLTKLPSVNNLEIYSYSDRNASVSDRRQVLISDNLPENASITVARVDVVIITDNFERNYFKYVDLRDSTITYRKSDGSTIPFRCSGVERLDLTSVAARPDRLFEPSNYPNVGTLVITNPVFPKEVQQQRLLGSQFVGVSSASSKTIKIEDAVKLQKLCISVTEPIKYHLFLLNCSSLERIDVQRPHLSTVQVYGINKGIVKIIDHCGSNSQPQVLEQETVKVNYNSIVSVSY
jgi:hypothetical protein